jgi:integrase
LCRKHITPELGKIPLTQLRATQIQSLYSAKLKSGLSARTVQLIHVCLHKALKSAVKTGLLILNPADNVIQAKPEKKDMRILQQDDISIFLDAAKKTPYYALFHCYLFTGVRRSELLALRWIDLDLYGMQMSINRQMKFTKRVVSYKTPKTKSGRRMIDLSPESCHVLREHREYQERIRRESDLPPVQDTDLVFCRFDNSPYLPDGITHSWTKLVKKCGYDVTLHGARHSHASLLLKSGVSPKVIQERLGHASISTTLNLYAHVVPGMQKAAALAFEDAVRNKVSENNSLDSR